MGLVLTCSPRVVFEVSQASTTGRPNFSSRTCPRAILSFLSLDVRCVAARMHLARCMRAATHRGLMHVARCMRAHVCRAQPRTRRATTTTLHGRRAAHAATARARHGQSKLIQAPPPAAPDLRPRGAAPRLHAGAVEKTSPRCCKTPCPPAPCVCAVARPLKNKKRGGKKIYQRQL